MIEIPYSSEHPLLGILAIALNGLAKVSAIILAVLSIAAIIGFLIFRRREIFENALWLIFLTALMYSCGGWVFVVVVIFIIVAGGAYLFRGEGDTGIPDSPAYHQDHWGSLF